jgi:hypothetical protein
MSHTLATCARCHLAIVGASTVALGRSWHPQHFTCGYCKKPFEKETFYTEAGEPYHRACFSKAFRLICIACDQPCPELYYRDDHGSVFCGNCNQHAAACNFCGRRLAAGKECDHCIPLISDLAVAKKDFQACIKWLATAGVALSRDLPQIRLRLEESVKGISSRCSQDEHHLGWTEVKWIQGSKRQITEISVEIKRGLPELLFRGVSIHELGHVWLLTNGLDRLDPEEAEGFCELLSYLYYKTLRSKEADLQGKRIRENPNPIYGGGFRCIIHRYKGLELNSLIAELSRTGRTRNLRTKI